MKHDVRLERLSTGEHALFRGRDLLGYIDEDSLIQYSIDEGLLFDVLATKPILDEAVATTSRTGDKEFSSIDQEVLDRTRDLMREEHLSPSKALNKALSSDRDLLRRYSAAHPSSAK